MQAQIDTLLNSFSTAELWFARLKYIRNAIKDRDLIIQGVNGAEDTVLVWGEDDEEKFTSLKSVFEALEANKQVRDIQVITHLKLADKSDGFVAYVKSFLQTRFLSHLPNGLNWNAQV